MKTPTPTDGLRAAGRIAAGWLAVTLATGFTAVASAQDDLIIRGPYLQSLLSTSVRVVWQTSAPVRGAIVLSRDDTSPQRFESRRGTLHVVDIAELEPDATYRYDVFTEDENLTTGAGHQFQTAPPNGTGRAHIVALGDSGTGGDAQQAVARLLCELQPNLFLHTGDLDYVFNLDRSLFDPYRETMARTCLYPSRGNHDLWFTWGDVFFVPGQEFGGDSVSYYAFDWAAAHFIVVDTNKSLRPENEHMAWLKSALESARAGGQTWLILLFHEPPFNAGRHYAGSKRVHDALVPLFDEYQVDLVLSGHDHNYQRSYPIREGVIRGAWQSPNFVEPRGTLYVVSGGGGQIIYERRNDVHAPFNHVFLETFHLLDIEIFPTELTLRALGPDGAELDAFTIRKGTRRPALEFLRGDTNHSGRLDLVDVLVLLNYLFANGTIACPTVAKIEGGSGPPTLTDAVATLNYLFLGGLSPAPPFPGCGPAPLDDDASCLQANCEN